MMRILLRQFDGVRCTGEQGVPADVQGEQVVEFGGATWGLTLQSAPRAERAGALGYTLSARVVAGRAVACTLAVEWTFADWSTQNFVLMPAAVYAGNRFDVRHQRYAPMFTDPADIIVNPPTVITDVPRLNAGAGASRVHVLTGDMATPAVGIRLAERSEGFWLLTEQGSALGNHGLQLEESEARTRAVLRLEAPGVRETVYTMMSTMSPSDDRAADWDEGGGVTLRFQVECFSCATVQALYDRFARLRLDLSGAAVLQHGLPLSANYALHAAVHARCWNPEGYYALTENATSAHGDWQLGWVGGILMLLPLLVEGESESRTRAMRNIDWLFETTQAESGLCHGVYSRGTFSGDGFGNPGTQDWVMARKNADGLYFLIKLFRLIESQGGAADIPAAWREGTLRLADCFCRIWARYGQIGQFLDVRSGDIVVGGSAAAGILPGALALAAGSLGRPEYLAVAEAVADFFVERFVKAGFSTGGPGEILQCPDSESAFALLESFVVLYEVTGKPRWLAEARDMANQCLTWCQSYDYRFPPESVFGGLGMRTAGSVWANVQNKHDAPGICTFSGDSLFKLYRYTGERRYLELIQAMAHNMTAYTARADRPITTWSGETLPPGYMNERVNTSDWEGKDRVGGVFLGSCWCEVSAMLAYTELPGLYVQPDTGFVCALDHLDAEVVERRADGGLVLQVTNPTAFAASYRVLAEPATAMGEMLGTHAMAARPRLSLAAGASVTVTVRADGSWA